VHTTTFYLTYHITLLPIGERGVLWWACMSVYVCLFSIISAELHVRSSPNFFVHVTYGCGRSSSNSVVIRYVFPVLWMTSYLHISQLAVRRRRQAEAVRLTCTQPWAWCVGIPFAGSGRSVLLLAVRAYWRASVGVLNIYDVMLTSNVLRILRQENDVCLK